jgi:hypothetical protein
MAQQKKKRLSLQLLQPAVLASLRKGYQRVRVDPERYLRHVRRAHQLPIKSWGDMLLLGPEVVDPIAKRTIVSATRVAALEGMGFGIGGMLTILPDMGVLSTITIRLLQKLSLLYGFEYATDEQVAQLWIAAASAAGLDLGREFIEKQAIERLVPRIIDRMAVKMSAEIAEKWSGRIVPVLSAGIGGTLNYYFVRTWGRRAQKHLLARHNSARANPGLMVDRSATRLLPTSTS